MILILKKNVRVNSGQDANDSSANSDDVGMMVPHQSLESAHSKPDYSTLDVEGYDDREFEVGPFNSWSVVSDETPDGATNDSSTPKLVSAFSTIR